LKQVQGYQEYCMAFILFEDDDKCVFTNLWIQPVQITFPISNTEGGKPKGNSSAAETSRVQGM